MLAVATLAFTCAPLQAQVSAAVQVPLETSTGWGPVKAPEGYKALRIQGRTSANIFTTARLFADFRAHHSMFPRVVDGVDILACDATSLKMRYRTVFDPRPGGKTKVQTLSTVKATMLEDRVEFIWSSNEVDSDFIKAVWGRALFVTQRTATGTETLVDYVSAVRPRNAVKGVLVESQKGVLAGDARYVIDRLMAIAERTAIEAAPEPAGGIFKCAR